ncbi:MAG: hypothetical protein KBC26_02445 [Candidatus Pacebacteria bacterium]|nr:hypothetical protein [Candidatus Paceibacterota bacterium]
MKAILKQVTDFDSTSSDESLIKKNTIVKEEKITSNDGGQERVELIKKEIEVIEPIFIEVDDRTYIKFDKSSHRSETINVGELRDRKQEIETRLALLNDYSDENLLAWAKSNYPGETGVKEREQLISELNTINGNLNEIDGD